MIIKKLPNSYLTEITVNEAELLLITHLIDKGYNVTKTYQPHSWSGRILATFQQHIKNFY